jgi:hypothetical protein
MQFGSLGCINSQRGSTKAISGILCCPSKTEPASSALKIVQFLKSVVTETVKMVITIEQIFRMTTLDRNYFYDGSKKAQTRNTTLFRHYLRYFKPEKSR